METQAEYFQGAQGTRAFRATPDPIDTETGTRKFQLSRVVKSAFVRLGLVAAARRLPSSQTCATILRYHSVSASGDYRSPTIAVSPELFERQMSFLARHYNVFSLDELLTRFNEDDLPTGSVAITFDDGYLDNARNALPILARYGLPATFYVTSDAVLGKGAFWVGWLYRAVATASESSLHNACFTMTGSGRQGAARDEIFAALATLVDNAPCSLRSQYLADLERLFPAMPPLDRPSDFMMTRDDLRALHKAGMTVGAHTATHRILAGIDPQAGREELSRSKADLEEALDAAVDHFAYPNGHVTQNVDDAAQELAGKAGYRSAGTSRRGILSPGASFLNLPRQGINDSLGYDGFIFKLEETRFSRLLRA